MMRKEWISILLFSLIAVCCTAQTAGYKFYSQLDSVKTSGFYNISLTPELNAHLKTDYSDIRIVNDSGKWVPHVLHAPVNEITNETVICELKFVTTENTKSNTIVVIESGHNVISNLSLVIKNTAAERFCTLSGSDDKKSWFVINDSILIHPASVDDKATSSFRIDFPRSNYRFFKITIHNNNKDPFSIKGVELYSAALVMPKTNAIKNPGTNIQQKDSGKISYIKITQQQPYHFDDVSLKLSGVKYFSRKADLFIPVDAKYSFSNPGQLLQSYTVSNNSTLQFKVPISNAQVFYLLINNEDNLPLKITEVNTAVSYHYITSYLEKGERYKLIVGNTAASAPNYDLTNIKVADSVPFLFTSKITAFEEKQITAVPPAKNNNRILWAAIIAVLFMLLLFTQKMIKEVDKRKDHDSI